MKQTTILLLSFVTILTIQFLSGCKSGKKAYEHGNYYQSVLQSVDRLRSKPGNKKASETLQMSYPLSINTIESDIKNILSANAPMKWNRVYNEYMKVNRMYDEIQRSPAARKIINNPVSYYDKIEGVKASAAEESYIAANSALTIGTKPSAREAYRLFGDVENFLPGYKDARSKMDQAHYIATTRVLVEQIPVPKRYSLPGDYFQSKIEEFLSSETANREFLDYRTVYGNMDGTFEADHLLRLSFDDFVVGNVFLKESSETFEKDSVAVGETKVNDSTIVVYNTVKAKMTTFRKTVSSEGTLSMKIIDNNTNQIISEEKFPGVFVWESIWGSFNGDERALTKDQLDVCKQREVTPPPNDQLFIEFTKPIYSSVTSKLSSFYRNY